jgi:hypothetical protein
MPRTHFNSNTRVIERVLTMLRAERHGCTLKVASRGIPCADCLKAAKAVASDVEQMLRLSYLKGHDEGRSGVQAEPDRGAAYALGPYYKKL